MSKETIVSDENIKASGNNDGEETSPMSEEIKSSKSETKEDVVAYDSYRRLLGEKKKEQEEKLKLSRELKELRDEKKSREESSLKEQNDWKSLAERRGEELVEKENYIKGVAQDRANAKKLDSFLEAVGSKIDRKFWGLIGLDKILINPDTGDVDEMTVTKQVEAWKKEYPETLGYRGSTAKLPTDSPKPEGVTLDYNTWTSMSAKDMKKNYQKVRAGDNN